MANTKLDRIERDIEKTRAKILEYQKRLKDLEAQKIEEENAQIVQMVICHTNLFTLVNIWSTAKSMNDGRKHFS